MNHQTLQELTVVGVLMISKEIESPEAIPYIIIETVLL